jgi:ubiquinone/menaquinone biosynthesis C-methylase UbiE
MTLTRAATPPGSVTRVDLLQRDYYVRTAHLYDAAHVHADDEHGLALQYISTFIDSLQITSILDVGCGTGRGVSFLLKNKPHVSVRGIEPVTALIRRAVEANGIPGSLITQGNGESLPFANQSIDAAFACGILHHASNPEKIVREMLRVSRKAVFLSDENRFAHGSLIARWAKFALCKVGIFRAAYRLKTLGKGYRYSEGDGLAYSYSVYDSIDELSRWGDRVILIPVDRAEPNTPRDKSGHRRSSTFQPLLTSFHLLLCAIRDPKNGNAIAVNERSEAPA